MSNSYATAIPEDNILRWLHLTDLHVGKKNESQQTALASLISAITHFANNTAFDLVLLTGDLAYSGSSEEYLALQSQVIDPLKANPLFANAEFYAVPGNHDVDCEIGYPPVWNDLGASRQDTFFHLGESGQKSRRSRSEVFRAYSEFVIRCGINGVDPTQEPVSINDIKGKQRKFSIVSVVTSFFSDKEVPDQHRAPAPVHPLRTILQDVPSDTVTMILGHHPGDWFTPESDRQFHSLLVEKQAIYLHGHEHCVRTRFGGRGLTSLGFGSAYQAPSDNQKASFYRNSFAICELADQLHIRIVSWDSSNGQWRPDSNLPGDFIDRSTRLTDGYCLSLPSTRIVDQANRPYASIASAVRSEVSIDNCIWLADNDSKRWAELMSSIGQLRHITETFALPTQMLAAGHCQFRLKDQRGLYLMHAISGQGDILTYEQLQAINTELDKQDYIGSIVATLGTLSAEAQTLSVQLESRKPIKVLQRTEIVRGLVRTFSPSLSRAVAQTDSSTTSGTLIITQVGFALLLQDKTNNAWFNVLGEEGESLLESSDIVCKLRVKMPNLRSLRYELTGNAAQALLVEGTKHVEFDRTEYLRKTYAYFDDVKYAPLAALGFRFRKASLAEIYVDASADVGGSSKTTQSLTRAVSEFMESLDLPKAQRDQLESQLRSRYGLERTAEVGAARQLYQRYNNVIVLGDPGSGKTCFVKHELLAYCTPPNEQGSWYGQHIPIYVSLAEAARLLNGQTDILDICEIVSARRGIALPRTIIDQALSDGRVAFFFDGLDEVGYIDKRIALVAEVDNLVKIFAQRGNRFVMASRPAAIQPVDIPDALTYLQLKGLTEGEMRTLAGRVLTVRLGEGDEQNLTGDEVELVERLLEDTRNSPGIARIARNPLLLTLLVLIYANTGALSARRHLIYTQAIKTLVSVRGRQTREQQISEADLRTRLGALAVGIFSREIAEIPKRSEVVKVLTPFLSHSNNNEGASQADVANAFIQEVAEATGLLNIHPQNDVESEDVITFMHYSFLEYYAAAGLLARNYKESLPYLAAIPRWKDVTTLLFGILSEQGDVTPVLKEILVDKTPTEVITKQKLLLALECASECDVAPEAAQDLLAGAIYETVAKGSGRYSSDLREKLAANLEYFLQGAGPRIEVAIINGLRNKDPITVAAFCDLVARVGANVTLSADIVAAFNESLKLSLPIVRASAMFAIERRPEFRSDNAQKLIQTSLKGSLVEKHAALKVIGTVPAYAQAAHTEVQRLLDDTNVIVSGTAAQCMLTSTLQGKKWLESDALQERVLTKLNQSDRAIGMALPGVTLDRETIESLISSGKQNESELAIRYIPLIRDDDQFVYQVLIKCLRSSTASSRHKAACMDSIRVCPGARNQITISDTDIICSMRRAKERNLRIAALKLLGEMPDDEQVVQNLQDHLIELANTTSREDEVTEAAKALAAHVRRNPRLRDSVLKIVLQHLPDTPESGFGDESKQHHLYGLLLVCESIGGWTDDSTAQRLLAFAESYRTPLTIRKQSMRVFGRIVEPSPQSVNEFIRLLERSDVRMNDSVYAATSSFISHCRRRVEHVRRVHAVLAPLRDILCKVWHREVASAIDSIDPSGPRDIRNALIEIEALTIAYEEFSCRKFIE